MHRGRRVRGPVCVRAGDKARRVACARARRAQACAGPGPSSPSPGRRSERDLDQRRARPHVRPLSEAASA